MAESKPDAQDVAPEPLNQVGVVAAFPEGHESVEPGTGSDQYGWGV